MYLLRCPLCSESSHSGAVLASLHLNFMPTAVPGSRRNTTIGRGFRVLKTTAAGVNRDVVVQQYECVVPMQRGLVSFLSFGEGAKKANLQKGA